MLLSDGIEQAYSCQQEQQGSSVIATGFSFLILVDATYELGRDVWLFISIGMRREMNQTMDLNRVRNI